MIFLVYCIASLFYYVFCPYVIYFPTFMARYSLFLLKVPLNPKQTNKQTMQNALKRRDLQILAIQRISNSVGDIRR